MAGSQDPPLDETVWAAPEIARDMGGIHTNTILPYFSQSHFFDATSNNATLTTQALYNQNLYPIIQTREAFEGRLRTMQGLEFMVTHDPSENDTKHDHNGVWVIRKQTRRKRQGIQDEITGINSYFVVGENVYMAPSIGNILSSRLLSTIASLTKALSAASTLPDFTPALGHTYLPLTTTKDPTPIGSSLQTTQTSEVGSPLAVTSAAAGISPLPATQETITTTATKSSQPSQPSTTLASSPTMQSSALLATSFELFLHYGNEYMDEKPLIGEPGSFKLSKAREPGLGATAAPSIAPTSDQPLKTSTTSPTVTKKMPPLEVKTDLPRDMGPGSGRKGSSSGVAGGGAKSPTTPGGGKRRKERRKSRAVGVEEGGTPRGEG